MTRLTDIQVVRVGFDLEKVDFLVVGGRLGENGFVGGELRSPSVLVFLRPLDNDFLGLQVEDLEVIVPGPVFAVELDRFAP
jgi:hypothetical protein